MTDAKVNFNFEESKLGLKDRLVTNSLGRALTHLELVSLNGVFGEVREFDGIAISGTGRINIDHEREIRTTQINTTDTFVVGGVVYFVPGGSAAAGVLRAGYIVDGIPVGICSFVNAGVAIGFKPYAQQLGGNNSLNVSEYAVDSALTDPIVITGIVPVGARIVDVVVKCTATVSGGTLQLKSNAASPAVITDAIICAVTKVVTRAGSLENDVVTADGLQIAGNAATNRGVMTIYWR